MPPVHRLDDRPTSPSDLFTVPDDIDSPRAKLVYVCLELVDGATIADLQDALDMKRIALYSVLDTLIDRDLVERHDGGYAVA